MNIKNYYFHTISKYQKEDIYNKFEFILRDGKLKSQRLLNNNDVKFNGVDYISLAKYTDISEYKTFIIDENNFNNSKLSKLFDTYEKYLENLKLYEWLDTPISKEEFFIKNNVNDRKEYYNYLASIARVYPVDIEFLYKTTNDVIYKYILDMIDDSILYCNKSEYCFEEYIRNSSGITFIFPKEINAIDVNIIPNLPFDIENKLVEKIENLTTRYSNQIGEVQVKDCIDINMSVGILINENISKKNILDLLKKYNFDIKIYKLIENKLVEL